MQLRHYGVAHRVRFAVTVPATHEGARMVRRWCIPLAGAALVIGSLAATAPAAAAGRAPHAPAAVRQIRPGGRMIRPGSPLVGHGRPVNAEQSSNWSGYAVTGRFTSVSANWTEPAGHCTSASRYSSFW